MINVKFLKTREKKESLGFQLYFCSFLLYVFFGILYEAEIWFSIANTFVAASSLYFIFMGFRQPYSLVQSFGLACLILLAIAPRIEMSLGIVYQETGPSVLQHYFSTSIMSLYGMWAFYIAWKLQQRKKEKDIIPKNAYENSKLGYVISDKSIVILSLFCGVGVYFYNGFSIMSVMFRSGEITNQRIELSQTSWLIYNNFIYALPSISLLAYLIAGSRRPLIVALLFLIVLAANPPTGMPRWQAAMLYVAILAAMIPAFANFRHAITMALFFGLLLIFPVLDFFRDDRNFDKLDLSSTWILQGHFDSMQNFARAVEINFVTYGWQLIGVIGFFIPRAIWENKATGSGDALAGIYGLDFKNIAMNYFGEGYVNFGISGVILFGIALGAFFGRFDRMYWSGRLEGGRDRTFYLLMLGAVFFCMRGDLLSSFAYLVGTYMSLILIFMACRKRPRVRVRTH